MKLQKLYKAYKKAQAESDRLDQLVENGAYDLEHEWDEAYEKQWQLFKELIKEVRNLTNVDEKTARAMIASDKFEQLMAMNIK